MKYATVLILIVLLHSCAARIDTARWKSEADEYRTELMRTESAVYGDFFKLRIFHSDLMQTVLDTNKAPYPALQILFRSTVPDANGVVIQRMIFDTTYFAIQNAFNEKNKVRKKGAIISLMDRYDQHLKTRREEQNNFKTAYDNTRKNYQDTCYKYGILRMGPDEYASIINEKIVVWQDSLEEIGRMIATSKSHLNTHFSDRKSKEYFAAYRPISDLEASLKQFESLLSQMQNALSRFEEGNREDFIYFGPGLRPRLEVQATEDLFVQAVVLMQQCREQEKKYYNGYR